MTDARLSGRPAREGRQRQVAADEEDEEHGVDQEAQPRRRDRKTLVGVDRRLESQDKEDRNRGNRENVQPESEREVSVNEGVKGPSRPAAGAVKPGHRIDGADRGEACGSRVYEDENEKNEKEGPEGEKRLFAPPSEPSSEFLPEHATS